MAPGYLWALITFKQNARENMRSKNKGTIHKIPKVKSETFAAMAFSHSDQYCGTDYQSTSETLHH